MTISLARAKKAARTLLRENRKNGRSWRVIAREDFSNSIPAGTLNRFALSKGAWFPKDERLQIILGLRKERQPRPKQKTVMQMNKNELIEHYAKRVEKMNLVLIRRGINARVHFGRQA